MFLMAEKSAVRITSYDAVRMVVPALSLISALAVHFALPNVYPEGYRSAVYPAVLGALLAVAVLLAALAVFFSGVRRVLVRDSWLFAAAVLLLSFWEVCTLKTGLAELPLMPSPDQVMFQLVDNFSLLGLDFLSSCKLLFMGLSVGFSLGIVSGLLMGWFRAVNYWVSPLMWVLGPLPAAVVLPIAVTVFPTNYSAGVGMISLSMWFAITYNFGEAVKNIDVRLIESARVLGASTPYILFHVVIPETLPAIFSGLFMGLCFAFTSLLSAEMITCSDGLGGFIMWAKVGRAYDKVYASMIVVVAFFFVALDVLARIQRRVLKWEQGAWQW